MRKSRDVGTARRSRAGGNLDDRPMKMPEKSENACENKFSPLAVETPKCVKIHQNPPKYPRKTIFSPSPITGEGRAAGDVSTHPEPVVWRISW